MLRTSCHSSPGSGPPLGSYHHINHHKSCSYLTGQLDSYQVPVGGRTCRITTYTKFYVGLMQQIQNTLNIKFSAPYYRLVATTGSYNTDCTEKGKSTIWLVSSGIRKFLLRTRQYFLIETFARNELKTQISPTLQHRVNDRHHFRHTPSHMPDHNKLWNSSKSIRSLHWRYRPKISPAIQYKIRKLW